MKRFTRKKSLTWICFIFLILISGCVEKKSTKDNTNEIIKSDVIEMDQHIEALAQASAVLVVKTLKAAPNSKGVLFASINNVKFRKPVTPGDTMELHV
ncbi:MAG: hypothetical protein ACMUIE_04610, partial [Thermoplasmatota archaeon]